MATIAQLESQLRASNAELLRLYNILSNAASSSTLRLVPGSFFTVSIPGRPSIQVANISFKLNGVKYRTG